jgi:hypothetical protein
VCGRYGRGSQVMKVMQTGSLESISVSWSSGALAGEPCQASCLSGVRLAKPAKPGQPCCPVSQAERLGVHSLGRPIQLRMIQGL